MGTIRSGDTKLKLMSGDTKVKRAYAGDMKIYSVGNIVTYYVDSGTVYQEEVEEGVSCLSPKTFSPAKSGWEFVGWRQDTAANGSVLSGLTMGDEPITLYAVFRQAVTVTYYNNSTTASSTSGYRYYNSGNVINPSFTLSQASRSGCTSAGWAAGNGTVAYANGATFTRDSNITLYGRYDQTITVTYYNGSTNASKVTGTRIYYSGTEYVINPTFTLTQTALSGWTARGWSISTAGNGGISYNNGAAFTRDSNITLYGLYYQTVTLTYYNGSTSAASTSGTRYYNPGSGGIVNPTFTLTPATLSGWTFRGWATSSAAAAGIAYSSISGTAFAASTTVYAAYYQTITLSYNGNGSTSGSTAAQTGTRYWNTGNVANPSFTLSSSGFSRSGYTFSKWALGSTGGTQYAAGTSVTLSASTVFYALWLGTPHYFTFLSNTTWSISDKFGESNSFNVDTNNNRITANAKGISSSGSYGYTSVSATIPTGGCTKVRLSVVGLGGAANYWVYGHVNGAIVCEANSGNDFTASGSADINGDSIAVTLRVVTSNKNYAATGALTEIYFYN